MNETVNNINIRYPDLGFAFNPIRILISNYTQGESVTLLANDITIEREAYQNEDSISFELSAIAKSLFDRREFYKIEQNDSTLLKILEFNLIFSDGLVHIGSIPVVWGALQIGETYTQNKHLTYFKGFPFTVPVYIEENIFLQAKADNGEYQDIGEFDKGKYNLDLTGLNANSKIELRSVTTKYYKIFDYTFDSTFGPQRVDFHDVLDIIINVVDCPNTGIYLRWINKYGEYNYYLFQKTNESTTTKNIDIVFDNVYYTTGLTDNYHFGTGKSIGKDIDNSIKLFASLVDSDTFDMLTALIESPVVDLFLGYDADNSQKWISVSVAEGTISKSTASLQDFEVTLVPNTRQVQTL